MSAGSHDPQPDPHAGSFPAPPNQAMYPPQALAYPMGQQHPQSMTVLILGILSVTIFAICGPFAWSMGRRTLAEIDAAPPMAYSNRSEANVGMVLGIIGTILLATSVLVALLALALVIGVGTIRVG